MPKISTRNLVLFPGISELRKLMKSLAMLDAILSPDWECRYFSFDSRWSKEQEMGSMRNGQGDDLFVLFGSHGCFVKGFVHDSPAARAGIDPQDHYRGIPKTFAACVKEPAFSAEDVTFCLWRSVNDTAWQHNSIALPKGTDPDGSVALLSPFDGKPKTYKDWAEDYYEEEIPLKAVKALFEHRPLTTEIVEDLNPDQALEDLAEDIREIGYPM